MHADENGQHGGMVLLDGEILQIGGVFVDPELAILNPKGVKPVMKEASQPIAYKKPWVVEKSNLGKMREILDRHGLSLQIVAQEGDTFVIGSTDCQIYDGHVGVFVLGNQPMTTDASITLFYEIHEA